MMLRIQFPVNSSLRNLVSVLYITDFLTMKHYPNLEYAVLRINEIQVVVNRISLRNGVSVFYILSRTQRQNILEMSKDYLNHPDCGF